MRSGVITLAIWVRNSPGDVDDVLFAQCYPSMDAPALGRVVALDAGLPDSVGGLQLDRRCGPRLQVSDSLRRGRVTAGGKNYPIAGGMIEIDELRHGRLAARRWRRRNDYYLPEARPKVQPQVRSLRLGSRVGSAPAPLARLG